MPFVKTCFGCINLRTGCVLMGIMTLVYSFVGLIISGFSMTKDPSLDLDTKSPLTFWILQAFYWLSFVGVLFHSALFILSALLLHAVYKVYPHWILPWIAWMFVMVSGMLFKVLWCISSEPKLGIILSCICFPLIAFIVYGVVVVLSHYQTITESEKELNALETDMENARAEAIETAEYSGGSESSQEAVSNVIRGISLLELNPEKLLVPNISAARKGKEPTLESIREEINREEPSTSGVHLERKKVHFEDVDDDEDDYKMSLGFARDDSNEEMEAPSVTGGSDESEDRSKVDDDRDLKKMAVDSAQNEKCEDQRPEDVETIKNVTFLNSGGSEGD